MDQRPVPLPVGSPLLPLEPELVPVELPEVDVPVPLVGSTDPDVPLEPVVPLPTVESVVSMPVLPRVPLLHPATPSASAVLTTIVIQPSFVRFMLFQEAKVFECWHRIAERESHGHEFGCTVPALLPDHPCGESGPSLMGSIAGGDLLWAETSFV
jgi:hypothetical protein